MTIAASDVQVDLGGHVLRAKQPAAQGLWINGRGDSRIHSVRVTNGSIAITDRPAVFMVYAWNSDNDRFRRRSVAGFLATARDPSDYKHTGFVLENLTLEARDVAVIMQGRGNTIRHCKIIGGNAAVNLYGPDLIFEDNEIVLNATETPPGGEPAVALYLEDANGSTVRNNRITIRGRTAGAEAIVLKNSSEVTLQNNSVNGGPQTYKLLDQQSSLR
jgi:hypothetical protein